MSGGAAASPEALGSGEEHDQGLVTVASVWSVAETIDRLQNMIIDAGLLVIARIDHAGNAARVGLDLRPTVLLIFGNPLGSTPLMRDRQTVGIDLPVKALAWEDKDGRVWLTYNRTSWLAERHGLRARSDIVVEGIETGLTRFVRQATGPAGLS